MNTGNLPPFEDLAALFESARPKTDTDCAVAACYFRNQILKEADVGAVTLAGDLKQIGHSLGNISATLHSLNVRTPSLVMITSKNKVGRKRYRITSAGVRQVGQMVARQKGET